MSCKPFYYSGLGECDALFRRLNGFLIVNKGTKIDDPELLSSYAAILSPILEAEKGIYLPITRGYQNNTGEPERVTSNLGITEKVDDPNVSLTGFLKASYCDYRNLYAMDGADVDFIGILDGGELWMVNDNTGYHGFRASFTIRKNAPLSDNVAEGTPVYIDFLYKDELDNAVLVMPEFNSRELSDLVPVGLTLKVVDSNPGADVTVKLMKRCSSEAHVAVALPANFVIISSKADMNPQITAVDNTGMVQGVHVLTLSGVTSDFVVRFQEDDGTKRTYVSNPALVKF